MDIASKIAGRIDTILVKEGQFVRQGEVLARMDTRVLNEQRLEAAAQIKEAESAVLAARALLLSLIHISKSTNAWICPTRLPRTRLIRRMNWTGWKPSSGNRCV